MKKLLLLALLFTSLEAQEETPPGYLNVLNLISLKTPTTLSIADFQFNEGAPAIPGEETGILAIKPNEYSFVVRNRGASPESVSTPVTITSGRNTIVICYADQRELKNGDVIHELRCSILEEILEQDLPRLSVVSLLDEPEFTVRIGGSPVLLVDRKAHRRTAKLKETIEIAVENRPVEELSIRKKAHYIVFLFRDPETGEVAASTVTNKKLDYQAPADTEELAD